MSGERIIPFAAILFSVSVFGGCVPSYVNSPISPARESIEFRPQAKIEQTVKSYEDEGRKWGERHRAMKLTPSNLEIAEKAVPKDGRFCLKKYKDMDEDFVGALADPDHVKYLAFFNTHSELKEAFKKGYRLGYQDRTADLVLGPHFIVAAYCIGEDTGKDFVRTINVFEKTWAQTLKNATDVFITLISEGSQADREAFIKAFSEEYTAKYNKTKEMLQAGGFVVQQSEGGTLLYIDASKTLAVLDIPKPDLLKTEIYHQTFKVMGDEWGKKLSQNTIRRDALIDLFRRSKTAFQEVPVNLQSNLKVVQDAFKSSYGTDADYVFKGLLKDAGY